MYLAVFLCPHPLGELKHYRHDPLGSNSYKGMGRQERGGVRGLQKRGE